MEDKWEKIETSHKTRFKEAIRKFEAIEHCVENWSGDWMSRRTIELRSDIADIDYLFAIAEIANTPIQNFVEEQVKAVFGINSSVSVVPGPVKRPSRAIAYAASPFLPTNCSL